MPTYLDYINAFFARLENGSLTDLSDRAFRLYFCLLNRFNRAHWNVEWLTVDNLQLMADIRVKREEALIQNREKLITAGLIAYKKGKKGSPSKYQLLLTDLGVKSGVKSGVKTGVKTGAQTGSHNKIKDKDRRYINYQEIIDKYNATCSSLPRCNKLSEARKRAIKARINGGYCEADFERLFEMAQSSRFLCGGNDRNWTADFDWLIKDSSMAKVLDGKYQERIKPGQASGMGENSYVGLEQRLMEQRILGKRERE